MSTLSTITEPSLLRVRWAALSGREYAGSGAAGAGVVFLHGLTFDHRMWGPVLDELPDDVRAIAFNLPGHGASPTLPTRGLAPVVDAVHDAVVDAGFDAPLVVGHSIGGPIAAIYASTYAAAGVVAVDAPIRLEPFAQLLQSVRAELTGDGFERIWGSLRDGFGIERLPAAQQSLLTSAFRPSRELFLQYQADLLERPLDEVVRWRDEGVARLRRAGTPYLSLHANPVDDRDRGWLAERLPQAEVVGWPVGHHFPHLADPAAFAHLVTERSRRSTLRP